jgi:hypothetical protein
VLSDYVVDELQTNQIIQYPFEGMHMTEDKKPGIVHYLLILFIMSSVILSITTFMFHQEAVERTSEVQRLKQELARCEAQRRLPAEMPGQ